MERVHLTITGRVQGVWYRAGTQGEAIRLGLVGWVRNLRDGRVEAVAEGPRPSLEALLAWCRRGPDLAWVEDVDADWQPASGEFRAFEVRPTSDRR
ncbi:acylphosphatase [Myxococcota bacterium]|nr:acylphosphatase [Myxococcota bacterium]